MISVSQLQADIETAIAALQTVAAHVESGDDYTNPRPVLVLSQREAVRRVLEQVLSMKVQLRDAAPTLG